MIYYINETSNSSESIIESVNKLNIDFSSSLYESCMDLIISNDFINESAGEKIKSIISTIWEKITKFFSELKKKISTFIAKSKGKALINRIKSGKNKQSSTEESYFEEAYTPHKLYRREDYSKILSTLTDQKYYPVDMKSGDTIDTYAERNTKTNIESANDILSTTEPSDVNYSGFTDDTIIGEVKAREAMLVKINASASKAESNARDELKTSIDSFKNISNMLNSDEYKNQPGSSEGNENINKMIKVANRKLSSLFDYFSRVYSFSLKMYSHDIQELGAIYQAIH